MGTYIMPGVEIGENSIVGAGSVMTKSIPANSVYAGNPACFICILEDLKKSAWKALQIIIPKNTIEIKRR